MRNMIIDQPKNMLPDLADPTLQGAWLNRRTTGGKDYSVAGDDMTAVGSPIPLEVGYKFGGSADYFRRAEANWRSADNTGTIEGWIKRGAAGTVQCIFSSADEAAATWHFLEFRVHSDNVLWVLQRDADVQDWVKGSTVLLADRWYYVGLTSNGSAYSLYVNRVAESLTVMSGANNGDWLADTLVRDNVCIGALRTTSVTSYFNGDMKEVNYYSEPKPVDWFSFRFQQGVPDDSLVLSIQDGTKDLSRYKRDITLNGDVIVGDGIELAGDNDYAELDPEFIEAVSAFTIMFYARSDAIDPRDIQIFKALVDNNRIITRLYIAANGVYDFEVRRTDGTDSNAVITSPFQHKGYIHTALVFNGKANMYINGDFVDDGDVIGDVTPTGGATQYFRIGGSGNTLDGTIKDYKVLLGGKSADWIKNYVEQSKGRY